MGTTDEDEDIRLLLVAGSEVEIRDAFVLIDKRLRIPICVWVRKMYYPGMSVDDLADMWADTMTELLKKVRDGKYEGDRKVFSDLCQIISRNTIDLRRRHQSRDKAIAAVGNSLAGTLTGRRWKDALPEHRWEVLKLIREEASKLPEKQRQVLGPVSKQ